MTPTPDRGIDELLRERLHHVDAVEPPDPEFEFRALRAGRERLKRRQAWTRGLVAAAAAVVVAAVAVHGPQPFCGPHRRHRVVRGRRGGRARVGDEHHSRPLGPQDAVGSRRSRPGPKR